MSAINKLKGLFCHYLSCWKRLLAFCRGTWLSHCILVSSWGYPAWRCLMGMIKEDYFPVTRVGASTSGITVLLNVFNSTNTSNCTVYLQYLHLEESTKIIWNGLVVWGFFFSKNLHLLMLEEQSFIIFYQAGLGNKLFFMGQPGVLCVFVWPEMQRIQLPVSLAKPWDFAPPDISVS